MRNFTHSERTEPMRRVSSLIGVSLLALFLSVAWAGEAHAKKNGKGNPCADFPACVPGLCPVGTSCQMDPAGTPVCVCL